MGDDDFERSFVEHALFNEPYLALLVALAARHYQHQAKRGMPWPLAFVAVPLVVHQSVRDELPGNTTARFGKWIAAHPLVRASFGERAYGLTPFVRRGIRYAVRTGIVTFDGDAISSRVALHRYAALATPEARDAGKQAAFVGRWFAAIGDMPAIFRLMGIVP